MHSRSPVATAWAIAASERASVLVVNDDLDRAVDQVNAIVDAEGLRHERVHEVEAQVEGLIAQLEQEINDFTKGE